MPPTRAVQQLILIVIMALVSACATSTAGRTSVIKTLHNVEDTDPFSNVLVVSAAGERSSRASFEHEMAAAMTTEATVATAFFAVAGRHSPISRNVLDNAVRTREFDAILLVRMQGRGNEPAVVTYRPIGRHFDLYHDDHEGLNNLLGIDGASTISFVAEFYDTGSAEKIWAIESLVFEPESVAAGVSQQVAVITAELRKDRLVGH